MSLDAVIRINRAIVAIEVMLKLDCKFTLNNKKKPKTKILFLNKICIFLLYSDSDSALWLKLKEKNLNDQLRRTCTTTK